MLSENSGLEVAEETSRVLLIDLENCPNQIHQLMKDLQQFSQVVICYAQSGAKIPIDWIMPLTQTVNSNRLKIFKTPGIGKNAADFGITFWAGVLMQQLPQNTHFTVVSEDADLDHVINLLKSQGRTAERINTKKEQMPTEIPTQTAVSPQSASPTEDYCIYLIKHSKTRPAKQDTLLNSIKTKFKDSDHDSMNILNDLVKHGAIVINNGAVTYNDKVITKIAALA